MSKELKEKVGIRKKKKHWTETPAKRWSRLLWKYRYIYTLLCNVTVHCFSKSTLLLCCDKHPSYLLLLGQLLLSPLASYSISVPFPPVSTFHTQLYSALSVFQVSPTAIFPSSPFGNKTYPKYFFFFPSLICIQFVLLISNWLFAPWLSRVWQQGDRPQLLAQYYHSTSPKYSQGHLPSSSPTLPTSFLPCHPAPPSLCLTALWSFFLRKSSYQ